MSDQNAYRDAKRHVERKLGFLIHLAVYLTVNSMLLLLNLRQSPGVLWSFGPLFGWGIGLLFHGLSVLLRTTGSAWKQRMIENELKKRVQPPTA